MIAESPLALAYILQNDVYLLAGDKAVMATEPAAYTELATIETPMVSEPAIVEIKPAPVISIAAPEPVKEIIPAIPAMPKAAPVAAAEDFKFKGGNQQRFLVIVHYPVQELMEPGHLTALENAITRKGLNLDDTAIFNIALYPGTQLKAIGAFFKPQKMLLLGRESFPEGLETTYPLTLNIPGKVGKCDTLFSFSFNEMMGNKEKTKAFWEQMRTL